MADNAALHKARRQQNDEFYTQLVDVENELRHYRPHFKDKTVYCNCDDPYESSFFKYFASNFNALGLKRLITTSYAGSAVSGQQLSLDDIAGMTSLAMTERTAYKADIREVPDLDGDGAIGLSDVELLLRCDPNTADSLEGNGDFRSPESTALLRQADIVVTNPPFSLFREYLAQLMEHGKQFLILGQQNAITYKEVFQLIADGRLWPGYDNGGKKWFRVPMDYDIKTEARKKIVDGIKYFSMGNVRVRRVLSRVIRSRISAGQRPAHGGKSRDLTDGGP
ncbi:adenine-specific methyltransferase EcoRI family protein [Candidatus Poriferisodalis sp.]|uniref:adenine-specific methyltransferase EcoRI family protein n=1 Tax=Candidatus Poriferisodalis sp. TaxID=3101277 RepID=UPI003B014050